MGLTLMVASSCLALSLGVFPTYVGPVEQRSSRRPWIAGNARGKRLRSPSRRPGERASLRLLQTNRQGTAGRSSDAAAQRLPHTGRDEEPGPAGIATPA